MVTWKHQILNFDLNLVAIMNARTVCSLFFIFTLGGISWFSLIACKSIAPISVITNPPMDVAKIRMNDTIALHEPIVFDAPLDDLTLLLKEIIIADKAPLKILLEVAVPTYEKLEEQQAFHNTVENRLDDMPTPFGKDQSVYLTLEWRMEYLDSLPSINTGTAWKMAFEQASSTDPLLQEKYWNLLSAMQHHQLSESIGGGIIRSGYRTKFTKPLNKNDALRRKGPVTAAIVQGLIESYFPVDYQEEQEGFILELKAGGVVYDVLVKAQEEQTGLWIQIQPQELLNAKQMEQFQQELEAINAQNLLGNFHLDGESLVYEQQRNVPEETIHYKWVQESLLTAVSLVHQQYQHLFLERE